MTARGRYLAKKAGGTLGFPGFYTELAFVLHGGERRAVFSKISPAAARLFRPRSAAETMTQLAQRAIHRMAAMQKSEHRRSSHADAL